MGTGRSELSTTRSASACANALIARDFDGHEALRAGLSDVSNRWNLDLTGEAGSPDAVAMGDMALRRYFRKVM